MKKQSFDASWKSYVLGRMKSCGLSRRNTSNVKSTWANALNSTKPTWGGYAKNWNTNIVKVRLRGSC